MRQRELLELLNRGGFHSGEALARTLGVSRAAVWKIVGALRAQGIDIYSVRGRGYRLARPVELLDREAILDAMDPQARRLVADVELHERIDSTNTHLMERARDGAPGGLACLAETQTAGRGRRGRHWVSPYAAGIALSVLWRFAVGPALLTGLSLAAGVAAARAVSRAGVDGLGLKWPNDLFWQGRKLGGILLEFGGEGGGPCHAVVGIGLNLALPPAGAEAIEQPWIDLRALAGTAAVSRNALAGAILGELVLACARAEQGGLAVLLAEWAQFDLTAGREVRVLLPGATIEGRARGVDESGALLLECDGKLRRFVAGEVSLRLAE